MKKIILFYSVTTDFELNSFKNVFYQKKIQYEIYHYKDIYVKEENDSIEFYVQGYKIDFKNAGVIIRGAKNDEIFNVLISYLHRNSIPNLNADFLYKYPNRDNKLVQYGYVGLCSQDVIKPIYYFNSPIEFRKNIGLIQYPIIMKPLTGSKGEGIHYIEFQEELIEKTRMIHIDQYLFQKYMFNKGDYRVWFIGGKYIGSMLRKGLPGSVVNNVKLGASVRNAKIPIKIIKKLKIIVDFFQFDYVGFDVIISQDKKEFGIIEINRIPSFQAFQKCKNIDIPLLLVEHLVSKVM